LTCGHDLLRAVIKESSQANIRLLREELFSEEELPAFRFLDNFYREHGEIPPYSAFIRKGLEFSPEISIPGEDPSFVYYYNLCVERQKFNRFADFVDTAKNCRDVKKQKELTEDYLSYLTKFDIYRESYGSEDFINLSWDKYQYNKSLKESGEAIGVTTGWPELDEILNFLQPGNLYVLSGRRNLGKSYILARMVMKALISRRRVLFVTMEMTAEEMADRMVALHLGVDPSDILHGRLSLQDEQRFEVTKDEYSQYPLKVIGGNLDKSLIELISEVKEYRPDVVFIDGSYMLKEENKYLRNDWEKQGNIHQVLKTKLAMQCNVPVFVSVQENRQSKGLKNGDGIVSRSDIIEQLATALISIKGVQNNENRRLLDIVKNRHGRHDRLMINFVFRNMDLKFDEEGTARAREELRGQQNRRAQQQAGRDIRNMMEG
jgi:replicative DNA helicase